MLILALLNVLAGLGLAYLARERVRVDGPLALPAFPLLALHAALVALIALYFYSVHPAWSWMYTVDPATVPALALVPLMAAHAGLVATGWYVGRRLVRTDPAPALRVVLIVLGLAVLVTLVLGRHRLGVSGSHHAFGAGRARGLFEVELGYAVLVAVLGLGASAGYVAAVLHADSRRVRTR